MTTTRIIILGPDDFEDAQLLEKKMNNITLKCREVIILTRGRTTGMDPLVQRWALTHWHTVENYRPERASQEADAKRDEEMCRNADSIVVFYRAKNKRIRKFLKRADRHGLRKRLIRLL